MLKNRLLNTKLTEDQIAFFYLGQEGFLLMYQNTYILIDPYLSDYVDRNCSTDSLQWKRNYAPPISPSSLDFIDYVFCTHDHYDHMDPDTLDAIYKVNQNTKFIIPAGSYSSMEAIGIPSSNLILASAETTLDFLNFRVTPLASAHEELSVDHEGNYLHLGYRFSFGSCSVYHAGDCCVYDGLSDSLKGTDILMLPINGRGYYKLKEDIIGNMSFEEALLLSKEAGVQMIIPMHFDLYQVNGLNPSYFVDLLYREFSYLSFHIFSVGEKYVYSP